jgi:predicted ArsR family transcriptional regulator
MERLDALGTPDLRAALSLLRAAAEPLTVDDVAAELDLPRSVARWRLERLAGAGLLVTGFAERSGGPGAGRPPKTYAPAPETEALEFPPRRYERLLALLAGTVPKRRLGDVGETFGRELAREARIRSGARPFARVCAGLGRLGFQASVEHEDADGAVVVTPTCPLRPLVLADDAARAIDQGMWRGLVAAALGAPADVRCHAEGCHAPTESCRVTIRLRRSAAPRASG